eukprot:m51a1_g5085 putative comm domain-containing protein 7 (201) ;mRNA; r:248957-249911
MFKFTQTQPDEQLFGDVQQLNALSGEQAAAVAGVLVSHLAGEGAQQAGDLPAELDACARAQAVPPAAMRAIVRGLLYVLKEAQRSNLTPASLYEDLVQLGVGEEQAKVVGQRWKASSSTLAKSVFGQTLTVNQLVDMKWRFGVTTANTERDKVGAAFMQFKFVLDKGNGKENVHMEMTLHQFYEFLQQMEQAKSALDYFS